MTKDDAFLSAAIFAVNPAIAQLGMFGRPDHHTFIILFMLIFLHSVVILIESKFQKGYVGIAVSSAICIWISPETLIPLLLVDVVLFLYTLFLAKEIYNNVLQSLYLKSLLTTCLIGAIILSSITSDFYLFFFIITTFILGYYFFLRRDIKYFWIYCLLLQLFLENIKPVHYDEISVVHFSLYTCVSVFCGIVLFYNERLDAFFLNKKSLLIPVAILLLNAALFLYNFPKFLYGMSADVNEYVKIIWLKRVSEMKSPFEHGDYIFFISHVVIIFTAIINKAMELLHKKSKRSEDVIWWILISITSCYTIFSAFAYRMLPYSVLFGFPLVIELGMNAKWMKNFHRLLRIIFTFFITIMFMLLTAYFKDEDNDSSNKKYTNAELFEEIDNLSKEPAVIMANSNDGPELLYYTKHSVVGAPYHRQTNGIIASYEVMEDVFRKHGVKNTLYKTNASYIFIRKSNYGNKKGSNDEKSLAQMIVDNKYPEWISIVKLPEKFDDIIIAKIDKNLMMKDE
jgi:hypothetical protein